jgi:hypothetical protein
MKKNGAAINANPYPVHAENKYEEMPILLRHFTSRPDASDPESTHGGVSAESAKIEGR